LESKIITQIEKIIGYTFKEKELLVRAFTHSSFVNENQRFIDYERLEFVGDATLGYIVAAYLYTTYPTKPEGELTKLRANMVRASTLSKVVDKLNIINHMRVGAGAQVSESNNVKSDLFEAIIGAMVIDNAYNLEPCKNLIIKHLSGISDAFGIDYKSKVLEYCAKNSHKAEFKLISKEIKDNVNNFTIALIINGKEVSIGKGLSKKSAEKQASEIFYTKHSSK